MLKKKIGVKMSATGLIRSLIEANWFVSDRMSPAANAPMMRAVPARSARTQSSSRNANADTTSTPRTRIRSTRPNSRSEEHTSELQSPCNLVCRLLLEKKKKEQGTEGGGHAATPISSCGRLSCQIQSVA